MRVKHYLLAMLALLGLPAVGYTAGLYDGDHSQRIEIRQVDDVASYNDGFMDGKTDCR